ncbi:RNA-binding S4 domain-containing protein [Erysipelotrichaceae bacterium OH741_COT-311]|nr:RNA-binding S4 domain-containing protein [Erysipelotrichaceae bacterium]MDO5085646.1 RNA-binding S4 domain-containing protein [Erysipelotrichaceae bacterium]RRC91919.1 RNA-binding S4 domain-containing protein [Erysipelotrichaceae bacterium OH741_COT-311]
MRLDKYLKVSRILKRRSVSNQLAKHQRVLVNDKIVKPAYEVKVDDVVTIYFGNRRLKIKVLQLVEHVRKEESTMMYEILEDVRVEGE